MKINLVVGGVRKAYMIIKNPRKKQKKRPINDEICVLINS